MHGTKTGLFTNWLLPDFIFCLYLPTKQFYPKRRIVTKFILVLAGVVASAKKTLYRRLFVQHFTEVISEEIFAITCDRCGDRYDSDDVEFNEFLTIDRVVGYGSIFGDGKHIRLDLCQRCTKTLLGPWIQSGKFV
jgi:antitoxin CcdA